jgi:SAM-dependent methyltransferase
MSMWVPRFACPECRAAVHTDGDGLGYRCDSCGRQFEWSAGTYRFLTPSRAELTAPFLRQYRIVREREGRSGVGAERRAALPDVPKLDPHAGEWAIRRESLNHLLARRPFNGSHRRLRVLDLGAGNGWLSHRLAALGHQVVALDQLDDEADGLGACRHYPVSFAAVQADFDRLPFEPGQFDLTLFNGSLHYSPDPLSTLREAARVMAPGGAVAVVDSPMFARDRDGQRMVSDMMRTLQATHGFSTVVQPGAGYLTFELLDHAAGSLGLAGEFFPSAGPWLWRARRAISGIRLGRAPSAFGVWIAQ